MPVVNILSRCLLLNTPWKASWWFSNLQNSQTGAAYEQLKPIHHLDSLISNVTVIRHSLISLCALPSNVVSQLVSTGIDVQWVSQNLASICEAVCVHLLQFSVFRMTWQVLPSWQLVAQRLNLQLLSLEFSLQRFVTCYCARIYLWWKNVELP